MHHVRERQVHVVASQQDVVAHGDPLEREVALVVANLDEREVGGPAPDVDDEDDVPHRHVASPRVAALRNPVVQRRLGLLEQHGCILEAGELRRLEGEFAGDGVERSGHREHDVLLLERVVGVRLVPSGPQMREVARRRLQRRDARDVVVDRLVLLMVGRRQDLGAAIDARMRQPALGGGDESTRCGRALGPGEAADHIPGAGVPGQTQGVLGELRGRRKEQERGQQRARVHLRGREHLRDLEGDGSLLALRIGLGQRAVRGAQIDADGEPTHSSTSAGATTMGSWASPSLGREKRDACQP